ncbi:DUF302 domain-containing protein [bacterium]|nr:DUF302 domain-containing protein [bacterium]
MDYYISKMVHCGFDEAVERAVAELDKQGFGILTEIDMQEKLRDKLGVEFRPYMILGACDPQLAHQALLAEDKTGVLMPCNVIVQQLDDGSVEVAAMNPQVMADTTGNQEIGKLAAEAETRIRAALDSM